MPEGRPIVADFGSVTERICKFIDFFLKPLSNHHPSYIKDTYHFVAKIRGQKIPEGAFLVTGDVTALYTNMDIDLTLTINSTQQLNINTEERSSIGAYINSRSLKKRSILFLNKSNVPQLIIVAGKLFHASNTLIVKIIFPGI